MAETTPRSKRGGGPISKLSKTLTPTNLNSKRAFFKTNFEVLSECRIIGQTKPKDKPTNIMYKDCTAGISHQPMGGSDRDGRNWSQGAQPTTARETARPKRTPRGSPETPVITDR